MLSEHRGPESRTRSPSTRPYSAWLLAAIPLAASIPVAPASATTLTLPPISIGAGVRADYMNTKSDNSVNNANDFEVRNVRLYLGGSVTDKIKLTINTDYNGSAAGKNQLVLMDAIARFEYSPEFNIWAGRMLPPSDRANLYGPFYANHWGVYMDGVQDGYANTAIGRDNGFAYWGDFGGLKISTGLFDVPETTAPADKSSSIIAAARIQYDFWDKEPGYWLNSTYYGEKNLLAIGAAGQTADGDTSYSFDLLAERNVADVGVFTLESEYANYKGLTGGGHVTGSDPVKSSGAYGLVSYLTPQPIGVGKVQLLGKYASSNSAVASADMKTTEFDVGYIVKDFNLRSYLFYINQAVSSPGSNAHYAGLGLQLQM